MAADLQMFLFLFKSKYRRKCGVRVQVVCVAVALSWLAVQCVAVGGGGGGGGAGGPEKCEAQCVHGACVNGTCVCLDGWQGPDCQFCGGKIRLTKPSGYITDGAGNYSINLRCTWLVDSGRPGASIWLHLEEFATECGWDHLYIYDGDSIYAPLLAVFSGLMVHNSYRIRRVPEIIAHSGYALLHFYSDMAYNMTGFNISYRINSCPSRNSMVNCSGNGVCIDGICTCNAGFTGAACDMEICPKNCSGNGECNKEEHHCACREGYKGDDCSQVADLGYWEAVRPESFVPNGSASHGVVVQGDSLWVIGGEIYGKREMVIKYDFNGNVWETVHSASDLKPQQRYGHSTVLYGDKIYMYGGKTQAGVVTNSLYAFDISTQGWERIQVKNGTCKGDLCGPLHSAGHTATVIADKGSKRTEKMVVIFGHSPTYGYLNTVQELYFGTREWSVVETKGYPVKGGYCHSSAWDSMTKKIYVYGGYISESVPNAALSNQLYSYEPWGRIWRLLVEAPSYRFLHTAVVLRGLVVVFGGNTHNDTIYSQGARCFSSDFLAYDISCDSWSPLHLPLGSELDADLPRFGHSAVTYGGSMYLYGGFNGQMLSDLLKYTPSGCESFTTNRTCLHTRPGVKCVWNRAAHKCETISSVYKEGFDRCSSEAIAVHANLSSLCPTFATCAACVQTSFQCVWCGSACSHHKCKNNYKAVMELDNCEVSQPTNCQLLHNCDACSAETNCLWDHERRCQKRQVIHAGNMSLEQHPREYKCRPSCSKFTSCLNCTAEECMWCQNTGTCVDKNAYSASFPYGQCMEWTHYQSRCRNVREGVSYCNTQYTCEECQVDPSCGWCDNGSGTGLGQCMEGASRGPLRKLDNGSLVPDQSCTPSRWHFTSCPACQCNGHSVCANSGNICNQPCANLTEGVHCEFCVAAYYGNPVNGGRCNSCECNNQGTLCHRETGKCYCTTKGITGDHCERCDTQNHYFGDPTKGGSCFYDLTIDYQFTFNLSKKEDRHYTQINFKNTPPKPDVDAEFQIFCSVLAKFNITVRMGSLAEKSIYSGFNCTHYKRRFTKTEYSFGSDDNTTFYVYVYDFQPPLWIQISFSQSPKLDLLQFFITFSTCFLLLLLVAAILWKIKQKYDLYRRRQRLFVEMEQMASRPFSQVLVEIEHLEKNGPIEPPDTTNNRSGLRKKKKECPSPIALEPCYGNRAAVLSLLVRLPSGGETFTPAGQSGIAIASALVTLGNPRKVSVDPSGKGEGKSKARKPMSSQNLDTCI